MHPDSTVIPKSEVAEFIETVRSRPPTRPDFFRTKTVRKYSTTGYIYWVTYQTLYSGTPILRTSLDDLHDSNWYFPPIGEPRIVGNVRGMVEAPSHAAYAAARKKRLES